MWPFKRREVRESQPFTDAVVEAIVATAGGTVAADPSAIAALEAATSFYVGAFAGATVTGDMAEVVTPRARALIARDLIRRGESVHLIEVDRGRVRLLPAGSWDVRGTWRERSWFYRVDLFGPSGNVTRFVSSASVIHARYAVDPSRPWHGISPLGWARATGTLAANLEKRLGEETGGKVAHLLPIPQDGGDGSEDDPLAGLKKDLAAAQGGTVLVETTSAGWGEGRMSAPMRDWRPSRIGADPPPVLPGLRKDVFDAVLSACGVPVSLVTDADGTSQREAFRRWLTTAAQPLGELVATELSAKLEAEVGFDFTGLYAHDLAGRAQAFQRLVAGGMVLERAFAISGLAVGE